MDPITIAGFVMGVIGFVLTTAVILRGNQLSRSRISVIVGPKLPASEVRWQIRRLPFACLVTGTADRPRLRPFAVPFIIENTSKIAVSDLVVRLEYPSRCLADKSAFIDPKNQRAYVPKGTADRERTEMQGVAYISINLGLLRPGETVATGELLALRDESENKEPESSYFHEQLGRAHERYSSIEGFVCAIPISVSIRAANLPPSGFQFTILWLQGASTDAVVDRLKKVAYASWDGRWPKAGTYLKPMPPRRRWWRNSRFTILHQDTPSLIFPLDFARYWS